MPVIGNPSSGGKKPTTPTIGTATDGGTGTTVSVPFTPSTYIGKGSITYTAVSNPGSISATGAGSPITVSGLTTGTAYTFTVKGDTNYGVASEFSASSNSITPIQPTAFESIATVTGTGSSSTLVFSNIPQTYKHLQIRGVLKATSSANNYYDLFLTFNGAAASSHRSHYIYGAGGTSSPGSSAITNNGVAGVYSVPASGTFAGSQTVGFLLADIYDYSLSTKNPSAKIMSGQATNNQGTAIGDTVTYAFSMLNSAAAVTSITVSINGDNFTTASSLALYGIKDS